MTGRQRCAPATAQQIRCLENRGLAGLPKHSTGEGDMRQLVLGCVRWWVPPSQERRDGQRRLQGTLCLSKWRCTPGCPPAPAPPGKSSAAGAGSGASTRPAVARWGLASRAAAAAAGPPPPPRPPAPACCRRHADGNVKAAERRNRSCSFRGAQETKIWHNMAEWLALLLSHCRATHH
jgi:hypothetical protein